MKFYRKDDKWYADIPEYINEGGKEEDCEMVLGADVWINFLANDTDDVDITISDIYIEDAKRLDLICKDDFGAVYYVNEGQFLIWLCNVNKFVFGKHPDTIFYKVK